MTALADSIAAQATLLEEVMSIDVADAADQISSARRLWLVGTGTSQHAAELGSGMFPGAERDVRWASSAGLAGEERRLDQDDAVVVISHTAQTAFSRRVRERALASGARVVSITGQGRGWPEAVETVPVERSETYTVSYLAALLVLARLAVALGEASFDRTELSALPDRVRAASVKTPLLSSPPERLLVLTGVGPGAVTAREGALKLREAARLPAEGYDAEYLLHGSAVPLLPSDTLIAIEPKRDRFGLLGHLLDAARGEGLHTVTLEEPDGLDPLLAQIPLTVRLQVLASHLADLRGEDPDVVIRGKWADDRIWQAGAP